MKKSLLVLFVSLLCFFGTVQAQQQFLIVFNGNAVPSNIEPWTWGGCGFDFTEGAGIEGKNALKWVQTEGMNGFGFTINPVSDLSQIWRTDSMKFKMKAEAGIDTMTMMFYDESYTIITFTFIPIADNQWHQYSLALRDFINSGTLAFDSTKVAFIEMNVGLHGGQGITGKTAIFTDWWIGNPVFDFTPPAPPTGLTVVPGSFTNLITWSDVPGEDLERYNVYYATHPITNVADADVVKLRIAEGIDSVTHELRAPSVDQTLVYYYAITATDAAGNISAPASLGSAVSNTAKGVTTISTKVPSAFVADGDLSEWAGITPIHMAPSGGGYTVSWGEPFKNDDDLTVDAYLAMDKNYFYVAFDVTDDVVSYSDPSTNQQDAPDMHIGLYNWRGKSHTSYQRGLEPDYLIRFAQSRVVMDLISNGDSLMVPGADYFWGEKFPTGYSIEARIPWTVIASRAGDSVFVPQEGYRIPLDFLINDADSLGYRESMLTYSANNEGNSWADVSLWSYTWIGNLMNPAGVNDNELLLNKYTLSQNYPNPFNPSTKINFSVPKEGMVTLKVFDILGREVKTLVKEVKRPGVYSVDFNGANLASGIYLYQINAGAFQSSRKMILIK